MNATATRSPLAAAISPAASLMAQPPPSTAHPFAEMLRQAHDESQTPARAPTPERAPLQHTAETQPAKAASQQDRPADTARPADRAEDDFACDTTDAASTPATLKARSRLAPPPGKNVATDRHADGASPAAADAPGAAAAAASGAAEARERRGTSMPADGVDMALAPPVGVVAPASTANSDASDAAAGVDAPAADAKSQRHRISAADAGATASPFGPHVAVREEKATAAREAQANAAQRIESASPRPAPGNEGAAAIAALAQAASTPSPTATAAPATPAPVQAYMPATVASPAFAAAFGMQVSMLARDGVQRAELHLNPAEMGPVAIRIRIEGREAHIDFGAEVSATRQAIEASLPQLAGALNDAGFTLTGGGVSQHTGHPARGGEGDADRQAEHDARSGARDDRRFAMPSGSDAAAAKVAHRIAARMAAGGIDLYA